MSDEEPIAVGDFVWASEDGTMDPRKAWAVGWVRFIFPKEGGKLHYAVGDKEGHKISGFDYPHARKITFASGRRIAAILQKANPNRRTIGDQIRAFLREEAAKARQ